MDSRSELKTALTQDRVYALIKDAIISARLRPGQRLRSDVLARSVKASRTPVREALSRLAQIGLVERDDGWGYVVRQVGLKDTLDMYNVREALEVQAARELFPMLTPALVAQLQSINGAAEQSYVAKRYDAFLTQNRAFHQALARATQNQLLLQMLEMINDRVRQVGSLIVQRDQSRVQELLIENRRVMAAIRKGDVGELQAAIQDHVRQSRQRFLSLLAAPTAPTPKRESSAKTPRRSAKRAEAPRLGAD